MNIKKITFLARLFYYSREQYNCLLWSDIFHKHLSIENYGYINIKKQIMHGYDNKLVVGHNSRLNNVKIVIKGSHNLIKIGNRCYIGPNSKLLLEGNNLKIEIGDGTRFTHDDELTCQEDNSTIIIGDRCLISHHVNIRTSDSHEIIDLSTQERINPPKSVYIGEHVWIAPDAKILKGVTIGKGSIIGSSSVVTKNVPDYCLSVGMPAKVVKENVTRRESQLF